MKSTYSGPKILVSGRGFINWGGGIDLIRNIISAMYLAEPRAFEGMILPGYGLAKTVRAYRTWITSILHEIATNSKEDPSKYLDKIDRTIRSEFLGTCPMNRIIFNKNGLTGIQRLSQKRNVDVILPSLELLPKEISTPWVGYLFDFQHRRLPDLFSAEERSARDVDFESKLNATDHIIVNAIDVANDAHEFFGNHRCTIHSMPFTPCPNEEWIRDTWDARDQYHITKPYFIICNQFWKHKNHTTAIDALAEVAQNNDISIVCTGDTKDYRFPDFFQKEIIGRIHQHGIQNRFTILGRIPKRDQISLLKNSIALIQPTLFEGGPGGGSAYEAISLDIPTILSDIPVNREIQIGKCDYFQPLDSSSLAKAMISALENHTQRQYSLSLLQQGIFRRKQLGDFLINVASMAAHGSKQ